MGHYDSSYEHDAKIQKELARNTATSQLELMQKLMSDLDRTCGKCGISKRHLEAFQDMMNETKVRTLT